MKKHIISIIPLAIMALLAGCGGGTDDKHGGDQGGTKIGAAWNATDACALLEKAALGAALKDNVTETSLALVNQASGPNAATSECTYILESGGKASLMARRSPIGDNTADAIATARNATDASMKAFGYSVEDVPGLGKAAFFVPGINQMNVFIDDEKFVILTISDAPKETAKATATELIKKIGR